jgi:hypothetical protein
MATITITARIIKLGSRVIQISNITEASISRDNSYRSGKIKVLIVAALLAVVTFGVSAYVPDIDPRWLDVGYCLVALLCLVSFGMRPTYELNIRTNAGSMIPLSSKNGAMIAHVLAEIQEAMDKKDPHQNRIIDIGKAATHLRFIESAAD